MRSRLARAVAVAVVVVSLSAATAGAHPVGTCASSTPADRCETWSAVYDDSAIAAPHRSDQFASAVAASDSLVFTAVKSVALDPNAPYDATATWVVLAHDRDSGAL